MGKLKKASSRLVHAAEEGEETSRRVDAARQAVLINLRRALDEDMGAAVIERAAADARASAQVVEREAHRMVLLVLCPGSAEGVIGGVLALD